MLSHSMVGTNNLGAARAFYDAVLGTLGYAFAGENERAIFYSDGLNNFVVGRPVNGEASHPGNGMTVGFAAASTADVDAFATAGVAAGGTQIEDPPGIRVNPFGKFYNAYLRDLDGNKICAIHGPIKE
jgi:catechol 2,3-dioxygenase-like lactoylglutathione lyase family enzyme